MDRSYHDKNYTSFVVYYLSTKWGKGRGGYPKGDAYFKFGPIGRAFFRRGAYLRAGANSRICGTGFKSSTVVRDCKLTLTLCIFLFFCHIPQVEVYKADTHEGFCFRSMLQGQFARLVHTGKHSVGACSILLYTRRSVFKFV